MKKLVLAGFLLAGILGAEAQTIATTTLTSGGNLAGTAGTGAYYGANAGKVSTAINNTFIGGNAGVENTTGRFNTFIGTSTGSQNTIGENNVFLGRSAGSGYSSSNNTITGAEAGKNSTILAPVGAGLGSVGNLNSFYGKSCGSSGTGSENAFFGANAGINNSEGSFNTYIGTGSGFRNNAGSGNVLLGYKAGFMALGNPSASFPAFNNQLYIDNSSNPNPLIWGDFAADQLKLNGKVGIGGNSTTGFGTIPANAGGVSVANYSLFVKGGILTEEIRVALSTTWADYVFAKDYNLKPLSEVETFINTNGHLPNVPSAKQVKEEGINVAEMATIQQEKIEELTLYIIAQNKRVEALEAKMNNK